MSKETGGSAFPWNELNSDGTPYSQGGGMSLRSYAAIHLRQPDSEHEWLNEMIRKAQRDELAGKAMQGVLGDNTVERPNISFCYEIADSMLAAREGK